MKKITVSLLLIPLLITVSQAASLSTALRTNIYNFPKDTTSHTQTRNSCADNGGLLINEFSNGTGGAEEYIELVVIGSESNPNGPVDLTGWIIDDNNGDFGGSGTAPGYIALGTSFNNMYPGDIIVIYNESDPNPELPGNDPTDSDGDHVYVLPANAYPHIVADNSSSNYNTTPLPTETGSWSSDLALRNKGDVVQVRCPDGTLFHALTYGDNDPNGQQGALEPNGASGSGKKKIYSLGCGGIFNADSYSTISASGNETPGAGNDATNQTFIDNLASGNIDYNALLSDQSNNCPEILPIELLSFKANLQEDKYVKIHWTTASETNNDFFSIERSKNGIDFETIGIINGQGNSNNIVDYVFTDENPYQDVSYYRLKQTDFDGQWSHSPVETIKNTAFNHNVTINIYPNPSNGIFSIDRNVQKADIINSLGQVVLTVNQAKTFNLTHLPEGVYYAKIMTYQNNEVIIKKLVYKK